MIVDGQQRVLNETILQNYVSKKFSIKIRGNLPDPQSYWLKNQFKRIRIRYF